MLPLSQECAGRCRGAAPLASYWPSGASRDFWASQWEEGAGPGQGDTGGTWSCTIRYSGPDKDVIRDIRVDMHTRQDMGTLLQHQGSSRCSGGSKAAGCSGHIGHSRHCGNCWGHLDSWHLRNFEKAGHSYHSEHSERYGHLELWKQSGNNAAHLHPMTDAYLFAFSIMDFVSWIILHAHS